MVFLRFGNLERSMALTYPVSALLSRSRIGAGTLGSMIVGAVVGILMTHGANGHAAPSSAPDEAYRQIPARYGQVIADMEAALRRKDLDAMKLGLHEDYSSYRITDSGPVETVHGRDATVEQMKKLIASPAWANARESELHRLGMVGNLLIQVDVDTRPSEKGPVKHTSLHIYEYKDGKVWREFTFVPKES
jgi:limonene-1,2-epoxide hydrolase